MGENFCMKEPTITFRALTEAAFPLLHTWLSRPHVTAWWEPAPPDPDGLALLMRITRDTQV
jgi:RimJ/RimL family protein N-acetyltransferase